VLTKDSNGKGVWGGNLRKTLLQESKTIQDGNRGRLMLDMMNTPRTGSEGVI
jgi:hypothetical protein